MTHRVVAAAPGGPNGASARYRLAPLAVVPVVDLDVRAAGGFPSAAEIDELEAAGGHDATLVLHRVLPDEHALARLRTAYRRIIFDFDDAIYTAPPDVYRSPLARLVREAGRVAIRGFPSASSRRRPLLQVLRGVDAAVAGNRILCRFAARYAKHAVTIPTTVDVVSEAPRRPAAPVVVWMGLPDNLQYLEVLAPRLGEILESAGATFRIVSSTPWERAPVPAEFVQWTPDASRDALLGSTVGLAPLTDSAWTRGKCAFRSIQYGAHALPVVASPVGITPEVVRHGRTGLLARTTAEWAAAVRTLLLDPLLADTIGKLARVHVARRYSTPVAAAQWQLLLDD